MKKLTFLIHAFIILILATGCEKSDNNLDSEINDGFNLVINNSVTYNSNSIDFYDFSSHLVYLKTDNVFSYSNQGTFSVLVDDEEIYTGHMFPGHSSYMPGGPVIHCDPALYNDYIIPIGLIVKTAGNSDDDPRNDSRIVEALKKNNQFKKGLSSEILSVQKISDNSIEIIVELINPGSDNLLILDPDKMGLELFHYFTNGLIVNDFQNNSYTHKLTIEQPDSWNSWETDWLTVINGNESKTISLVYNEFDILPTGKYTASFNYPGLSYQIEREELQQNTGRIWLGQLNTAKTIDIE